MLLPRILLIKSLAKAMGSLGRRLTNTSDVVDVVMFKKKYEADIINEANVVREIRSSQSRTGMGESAIKSVVDAVSKNTIDEESGNS
jgi:hypothetical protein